MKLPDIRYVDLRYKGLRILRGWKTLKRDTAVRIFGCFFIGLFLFCFLQSGLSIGLSSLSDKTWMSLFLKLVLMPSGVFAFVLLGLSFVCFPFWNYLEDLQRLCSMIYTYPLYLVRNYIGNESLGSEDGGKVKREILYFPRLYYRRHKGMVEITVRLDGSKFHQDGSFEDLTKVLEDAYTLNVLSITQRKEYLTYHMMYQPEKNRIRISQVVPSGYRIPLMRGLSWDLSEVPHGLVVGGTGGGKTFFLQTLIHGLLQMGADLYIEDPKYSALSDYKGILPHVGFDKETIFNQIDEVIYRMKRRYAAIKEDEYYESGQSFAHYGLSPIVLIMDEYTAYMAMLDSKEQKGFQSRLAQIILQGREAGVFVILATQRPDAKYLEGNVRDQLGFRVTLGEMTDEGFRMAFGSIKQTLKNTGGTGMGYCYMNGFQFVQRFCSPLVPAGYAFIREAKQVIDHQKDVVTGGKYADEQEREEKE